MVTAIAVMAMTTANELPSNLVSVIESGDYNKAQSILTETLRDKEISPESKATLHMSMLLELIRTTDPSIMTEYVANDKTKRQS